MKLDTATLSFNMPVLVDGGDAAWGTALGQSEVRDYRFDFEDQGDFLTGMLYKSVSDITKVYCPLGKGDKRQNDFDYVIASIFDKVYINDIPIEDSKFILLIVKEIANGVHIGRKTLKYNPRITYDGDKINEDFFEKAKKQLGLTDDAAWFIDEIQIMNQDELHLTAYICDKEQALEFENTNDRKAYIAAVVANSKNHDIFDDFQAWLTTDKNPDYNGKEKYVGYSYALKRLVNFMLTKKYIKSGDLNSLSVSQYEKILDEYKNHKDVVDFDKKSGQAGRAALRKYILYIKYILELQNHHVVGFNCVYYGAPGCGKSYYVENNLLEKELKVSQQNIIRTTFYQDYSNTDFVGQVLPVVTAAGNVTYKFNAGPFTIALAKALKSKYLPVALVIEEINRGSAASIFGDIFQLLDRKDDGESVFEITNINIQDYLKNEHGISVDSIKIPSNLFIVATMNTSDQNVFTLDTAFKRRWKFTKIRNVFKDTSYDKKLRGMFVPGMDDVSWEDMVMAINEYIVKTADQFMNEDKQIGVYFINDKDLVEKKIDITNDKKIKEFSYKILEYLWDDVAKFSEKNKWFKEANTLDELLKKYEEYGKLKKGDMVFSDDLIKIILDRKNNTINNSIDGESNS